MTFLSMREDWNAVLACIVYSSASLSITVVNKLLFALYDWNSPILLMLFQNCFTVFGIFVLKLSSGFDIEGLEMKKVKTWIPMNLLFFGNALKRVLLVSHNFVLQIVTSLQNLQSQAIVSSNCNHFQKFYHRNGFFW